MKLVQDEEMDGAEYPSQLRYVFMAAWKWSAEASRRRQKGLKCNESAANLCRCGRKLTVGPGRPTNGLRALCLYVGNIRNNVTTSDPEIIALC